MYKKKLPWPSKISRYAVHTRTILKYYERRGATEIYKVHRFSLTIRLIIIHASSIQNTNSNVFLMIKCIDLNKQKVRVEFCLSSLLV